MIKRIVDPPQAGQSPIEPAEQGRGSFFQNADLLDRQLTYTLFRVTLGVNLLHGAARLFEGDGAFPLFLLEDLPLPPGPFLPAALAFLTAGLGLLLALGLWTRRALIGGGALLTALVVGAAYRTGWEALTVQMIYLGMFYLLLPASQYNVFSADTLLRRLSSGKIAASSKWAP